MIKKIFMALSLIIMMSVSASATKYYMQINFITPNADGETAVSFDRTEIEKVYFAKDNDGIDCLYVTPKSGSSVSYARADIANVTFPIESEDARPEGSYGEAEVNSETSGGRTSCTWVQLWEGGPKFAEFNVGSVITSYANLQSTTEDTTATVSTTTSTENVGGLYAYKVPAKNGRRDTWSGSTTAVSDVATTLWGDKWTMPTTAQYTDMLTNCTITWCDGTNTQYVDGCPLSGWIVTGTGEYETNSIFFPYGGYLKVQSSPVISYASETCLYWATKVAGSTSNSIKFYKELKLETVVANNTTKYGNAVRAVLAE